MQSIYILEFFFIEKKETYISILHNPSKLINSTFSFISFPIKIALRSNHYTCIKRKNKMSLEIDSRLSLSKASTIMRTVLQYLLRSLWAIVQQGKLVKNVSCHNFFMLNSQNITFLCVINEAFIKHINEERQLTSKEMHRSILTLCTLIPCHRKFCSELYVVCRIPLQKGLKQPSSRPSLRWIK